MQHDWLGGGSVMVWGGECIERRTVIYMLVSSILAAIRYQDNILGLLVDSVLVQWVLWSSLSTTMPSLMQ